MKLKEKEKRITKDIQEYNQQYCKYCHHTITFKINQEKTECSWCHRINKNNTRGRFNYMMNKLLDKDYKVRRLKENDKDI